MNQACYLFRVCEKTRALAKCYFFYVKTSSDKLVIWPQAGSVFREYSGIQPEPSCLHVYVEASGD